MRQRGPCLSLDTDYVITPVAEPSTQPSLPNRIVAAEQAVLEKLNAYAVGPPLPPGADWQAHQDWREQYRVDAGRAVVPSLLPPWLPSDRRDDLAVLADSDVEWIDRHWRDAGGTEVTGFITTEPIGGPPLWFFVPLMVAVVVLGVVGAVVVALR